MNAEDFRSGDGPTPAAPKGLIDADFAEAMITRDAPWKEGHGASGAFLGSGILYYSIAYMMKSRISVCLGSGGGFVPRLMRQAQRDIGMADGGRTILVDGNLPAAGWGSPQWLAQDSFFRRNYPDVEVIVDRTDNAARTIRDAGIRINYLHIDADHSFRGCMDDFKNYHPLMAQGWVATIHDTDMQSIEMCIEVISDHYPVEVVNFHEVGRGVAIIRPRMPRDVAKLYEPWQTPRPRPDRGQAPDHDRRIADRPARDDPSGGGPQPDRGTATDPPGKELRAST